MESYVGSGAIHGPEKWTIFQEADVFVLPSHNECFPLTILEAMSAGLPVVASRIGGIPDMIGDGGEGFIVPMKDEEALFKATSQLCKDQALLQRMSADALLAYNQRYTIEHFRSLFLHLLNQYFSQQQKRA